MIRKYIKYIIYAVVGVAFVITLIASISNGSKARQRKARIEALEKEIGRKDSTIYELSKVQKAEVECQLNINVKNNKKGVLVIDS